MAEETELSTDLAPEEEEVEAVPVLAGEVRAIEPVPAPAPPALRTPAQVAAVAATGFVAGAATVAVLHRRRGRTPRRRRKRAAEAITVAGTRSFLVDVHLLSRE
jgi:hypothetical protein